MEIKSTRLKFDNQGAKDISPFDIGSIVREVIALLHYVD